MKIWIVYDTSDVSGSYPRSAWSTEGGALLELDRIKERAKQIGYTFSGTVLEAELDQPDTL